LQGETPGSAVVKAFVPHILAAMFQHAEWTTRTFCDGESAQTKLEGMRGRRDVDGVDGVDGDGDDAWLSCWATAFHPSLRVLMAASEMLDPQRGHGFLKVRMSSNRV